MFKIPKEYKNGIRHWFWLTTEVTCPSLIPRDPRTTKNLGQEIKIKNLRCWWHWDVDDIYVLVTEKFRDHLSGTKLLLQVILYQYFNSTLIFFTLTLIEVNLNLSSIFTLNSPQSQFHYNATLSSMNWYLTKIFFWIVNYYFYFFT